MGKILSEQKQLPLNTKVLIIFMLILIMWMHPDAEWEYGGKARDLLLYLYLKGHTEITGWQAPSIS